MNNTAIIILAAGSSSRFGSAKQLLHFNGKMLLQHVLDEAVCTGAEQIIVVIGANADEILKEIKNKNAVFVHNEHWYQGMASGIVTGVKKAITSNNVIENIIITVSDQPFVSADIFKKLYQIKNESAKPIVACAYACTIGTPVLFKQKYFDALMYLQGEEGAKKILKVNKNDIATIDFPQGNIDIDTQKNFNDLLDKQKHVL